MKLVSWNVNGLRAVLGKGLDSLMEPLEADALCFQEIKARREQVADLWLESWPYQLWNPANRPGYSGVLTLSKIKPLSTSIGIGQEEHDDEGRVCTMEFDQFYLVNCYTPNSKNELARLPYRRQWNEAFRQYVVTLAESKPVVLCGDLNVAHEEIDLARPKDNHFSAGFSDEEREDFTKLLDSGFIDTFRHLNPAVPDKYSWWSYRGGARTRNVGWRIDYFCISPQLLGILKTAEIYPEIAGSDHCPVSVTLD